MVFILSAPWWIRIRGLWKLPEGRNWLRGKLGLVLMGRIMLSKSLIYFSVWWVGLCSLPLVWPETKTLVQVMKVMETSFRRSQARTAALSAPNPAAGHRQPHLRQRPLDTTEVWASLLWAHGSSLLGPGAQGSVCASNICFPVLCKSWWLYGGVNGDLLQEGLCQTQVVLTQGRCPSGRPLLTCASTGHTQTFNIVLNDLYSY